MNSESCSIERVAWEEGHCSSDSDVVAIEAPVALVYNGISHEVTMATTTRLKDLALGFSLTEGIKLSRAAV